MKRSNSLDKIQAPLKAALKHPAAKQFAKHYTKLHETVQKAAVEGENKVKRSLRKAVCGNPDVRVRDHIERRRREPIIIKAIDKLSFTLGVVWLCLTEWWVLVYPETFGKFYAFSVAVFIGVRHRMYKKEKYHYFLYDFCYFVDFLCLLQVWAMPSSWHQRLDVLIPEQIRGRAAHAMFLVIFSLSCGPLAWAIPVWRISLVFHSLDKVTSVIVHFLPNLFVFCYRWFPHATGFDPNLPPPSPGSPPSMTTGLPAMTIREWFIFPMVAYCFWQALYLFLTEYWYKKELDQDPDLQTSLRWLAMDLKNGTNRLVVKICRRIGIYAQDEVPDPKTWKTLLVFITAQFIYTTFTLVPVYPIYSNFHLHVAYLIFLFGTTITNGAGYYIEIFASRYVKQFETNAVEHTRFSDPTPAEQAVMDAMDAEVNPETDFIEADSIEPNILKSTTEKKDN